MRTTKFIALSVVIAQLFGCAAINTSISKRNLDVQSKLSDTVFLDPVADRFKIVFVQVRNTSDKPELDIEPSVKASLAQKGYIIATDPEKAQFILQANILSAAKTPANPLNSDFGGYGAILAGGAIGALASAATGGSNRNVAGAALAVGALVGLGNLIGNALVTDVYYSVVVDLQIKEKNKSGVVGQESNVQNAKNGKSASSTTTVNVSTDMKTYQTRIMSVANQVNLEFNDAVPMLQTGLTKVISGIF
jgi:hypothetical protein